MGPRVRRSTVLTPLEEAAVVEFRRRTLLPLDDVLGRRRASIPRLSRSALRRCLQRHDIRRLPRSEERSSKRGRFSETRLGHVHVDTCEVRSAEGKLHLFLAIDRVSKFTYVELQEWASMQTGAQFLLGLIAAFPHAIHTVLTDNGIAIADAPRYRDGPMAKYRGHLVDRLCRACRIVHKLTKPYHPWTNGPAERMVRVLGLFHRA
jgi:transposase InsO family protein